MKNPIDDMPPAKAARLAGFLYLLFLLTQIFGDALARQKFVVAGDAAATAGKITADEWLFRVGFAADLLAALFFLLAAWALYVLLKRVNGSLALLFLLLNLAGVAIQCVNALNYLAALILLSGADYLGALRTDQLQALAMFFLDLYKSGFMIAQIFYGAWLLPLGYLVYRSGFLPRILGVLLMLDCAGVLVWFFQFFLFPGRETITYPGLAVSFVAEVSLTLWLLIRGVSDNGDAVPEPGA